MKWLAVVAVVVGCDRRPAVTSCDDNLRGMWRTDTGAWAIIDYGATLEAYPQFDDGVAGGAPRVIDLARTNKLAGEVKRRFTSGAHHCVATAPIRVAKCKDNTLQVVLADPQPPVRFESCAWGKPAESRVEHWHRE
jgi:hypothetical protein